MVSSSLLFSGDVSDASLVLRQKVLRGEAATAPSG